MSNVTAGHVCHIISGLNVGGAELMLKRLVESQNGNNGYSHSVISLTSLGRVGLQLQAIGIEVHALNMHAVMDMPRGMWRLVCMLRASRPDIVQTWMYHADLIGGLAARMVGIKNIIWGIRNTLIPQGKWSRSQFVIGTCAKLSRWVPHKIVCCAEAARSTHIALGYSAAKMLVIPNGYDLSIFNPTPELRQSMRQHFGFADDTVVIGIVGRFDPLKDYENFVLAAARVAALKPQARFMMVGRDISFSNTQLMGWLANTAISDRFILLGERRDVSDCLAAMDIFCLASRAEGFPNVVTEAMAMRVPCVVTDVGDAALIVQNIGQVVPPQDWAALADALITMVDLSPEQREALGVRARKLVECNYSIKSISQQYADLYSSSNF